MTHRWDQFITNTCRTLFCRSLRLTYLIAVLVVLPKKTRQFGLQREQIQPENRPAFLAYHPRDVYPELTFNKTLVCLHPPDR